MIEPKTLIRAAQPNDVNDVQRLAHQLGYDPSLESVLSTIISQSETQVLIVMEVEERVIGWIEVGVSNTVAGGAEALINGLIVDEARRGMRLGESLVASAENWAREQGIESLKVRSRTSRVDAHRFYRRLGYKVQKEQIVFRKSL